MLIKQNITYHDEDQALKGYYVYDDSSQNKKPAILVAHDWSGKNEFACQKAEKLASLGYIGFAIDMYGEGKMGKTKDEKSALMQPLIQNRKKLQRRILAAFHAARQLELVDNTKIGAIGFCFGGLCVLDLARSGINAKGVVSFHGLLTRPDFEETMPIQSSILVLHGYDDPMVTPKDVIAFADEMTKANVDWEINMYSQTMHGFTNPEANDKNFGTVYHPKVEKRAWLAMESFFKEIFA